MVLKLWEESQSEWGLKGGMERMGIGFEGNVLFVGINV